MSKKKKIIAIVIVAVIGTIVFWKRAWLKNKLGISQSSSNNEQSEENTNQLPAVPGIKFNDCTKPPYNIGCSGNHIKVIQYKLNLKHNAGLKVDGYFGNQTKQAIEKAGYGESLDLEETKQLIK